MKYYLNKTQLLFIGCLRHFIMKTCSAVVVFTLLVSLTLIPFNSLMLGCSAATVRQRLIATERRFRTCVVLNVSGSNPNQTINLLSEDFKFYCISTVYYSVY